MPTYTDPAPCSEGEDLYECQECQTHFCSDGRITSCPECGSAVENISKPRAE